MCSKIIFSAIIVTMILLAVSSHAITIDSYRITTDITDDRIVTANIVIKINNNENHSITAAMISLPKGSLIKSVSDTYGDLKYSTSKKNDMSVTFNLTRPLPAEDSRIVMLEIEATELLKQKGDYFEYLLVFTPKQNISDFEHLLKLPKNSEFYSSDSNMRIIFPETSDIEDDLNSGMKSVIWRTDLEAGQPEVFMVRFTMPSTNWLQTTIYALLAILALLSIRFLYLKMHAKYLRSKMIGSTKLMNENEKKIIELVIKNEGITQNMLREMIGYKKSAISKIITRLEARDILEKKKYGKVNRLYIGKRVKKQ